MIMLYKTVLTDYREGFFAGFGDASCKLQGAELCQPLCKLGRGPPSPDENVVQVTHCNYSLVRPWAARPYSDSSPTETGK